MTGTENTAADYTFEMVPTVTTQELHLAVVSALAAMKRNAPTARAALADETLGAGPYGSMTGEAAACMAAAISHVFTPSGETPANEALLKGLIWRGIFAFSDVVSYQRFAAFGQNDDKRFYVGTALLTALAETPMPFGGDVPVNEIFASARDAVAIDGHLVEVASFSGTD